MRHCAALRILRQSLVEHMGVDAAGLENACALDRLFAAVVVRSGDWNAYKKALDALFPPDVRALSEKGKSPGKSPGVSSGHPGVSELRPELWRRSAGAAPGGGREPPPGAAEARHDASGDARRGAERVRRGECAVHGQGLRERHRDGFRKRRLRRLAQAPARGERRRRSRSTKAATRAATARARASPPARLFVAAQPLLTPKRKRPARALARAAGAGSVPSAATPSSDALKPASFDKKKKGRPGAPDPSRLSVGEDDAATAFTQSVRRARRRRRGDGGGGRIQRRLCRRRRRRRRRRRGSERHACAEGYEVAWVAMRPSASAPSGDVATTRRRRLRRRKPRLTRAKRREASVACSAASGGGSGSVGAAARSASGGTRTRTTKKSPPLCPSPEKKTRGVSRPDVPEGGRAAQASQGPARELQPAQQARGDGGERPDDPAQEARDVDGGGDERARSGRARAGKGGGSIWARWTRATNGERQVAPHLRRAQRVVRRERAHHHGLEGQVAQRHQRARQSGLGPARRNRRRRRRRRGGKRVAVQLAARDDQPRAGQAAARARNASGSVGVPGTGRDPALPREPSVSNRHSALRKKLGFSDGTRKRAQPGWTRRLPRCAPAWRRRARASGPRC